MTTTVKHAVFAVAGIFAVVLLSGCAGSKNAYPTEAEVNSAYKEKYYACIPTDEWSAKEKEFGVKHGPGALCGYGDDRKKCEEKKEQAENMLSEWSNGKEKCDAWRKTEKDQFVSFKKTDGKEGSDEPAELQEGSGQNYTMYGVLTLYNAEKGTNEEKKVDIHFERRESGWHGLEVISYHHRIEFDIPR